MYSWSDDTSDWYGSASYSYDDALKAARERDAKRAEASGPRAYDFRRPPNPELIDPKKKVRTESRNPFIVAVDVTGSMSSWPFEIFDRLPLLYNTLAQYRPDLEILFAAIGDAGVDAWPLQVTGFAKGYDLEQQLHSLYGEGGGGDAPESYGLFAWWVKNHVEITTPNKPFLIVFGDAPMHEKVPAEQIRRLLGDDKILATDAVHLWREVAEKWTVRFLRRPTGRPGDEVDTQWARAVGEGAIVHIDDEQRAVDYAMGLVAKQWGHFEDFRKNMLARQSEDKVSALAERLAKYGPVALVCPSCGASLPPEAASRTVCEFCGATVAL